MTSLIPKLENIGTKTAVAGLSAGAIGSAMGYGGQVNIYGFGIPAPVYLAAAAAAGSGIQASVHDFVIPKLSKNATPKQVANLLAPAITGAGTLATDFAMNYLTGQGTMAMGDMLSVFLLGASSELIAYYATQTMKNGVSQFW